MLLSEPQGAGCVFCALQNQKKTWANPSPGGPLAQLGTGVQRPAGSGKEAGVWAEVLPLSRPGEASTCALQCSPSTPGAKLNQRSPGPEALPTFPLGETGSSPTYLPVSHVLGGLGLPASSLWT